MKENMQTNQDMIGKFVHYVFCGVEALIVWIPFGVLFFLGGLMFYVGSLLSCVVDLVGRLFKSKRSGVYAARLMTASEVLIQCVVFALLVPVNFTEAMFEAGKDSDGNGKDGEEEMQ